MAFDNTNRGSVWKNKKKEKETHPDFTGSLNVNGVEFWVNAWKRKDGGSPDAPALSFTVRPKDAQQGQPEGSISERAQATIRKPDPISSGRLLKEDMDDDIPFAPEFR